MTHRAYIAIGSNLGGRKRNCEQALELLAARPGISVLGKSPWFESEAVILPGAPSPQPDYVNGAAALETTLSAQQLVAALHDVEEELGRPRRHAKGGPRTIDLDLLLHGDAVIATPELTVPHPDLAKRRFVLQPLCAIAPQAVDPVSGLTVQQLLERCRDTTPCRRL